MKIGCAKLGKNGRKWVHTSTHTFEELQSWVSKPMHKHWIHPRPFLEKNQKFLFQVVQNPSIGLTANTTLFQWKCITATAANNFQLTFIQPMRFIFGWPMGSSTFSYPFVYKPIYTRATLGLTLAHNQMNSVSGVDSTSLRGAYSLGSWVTHPLSMLPSVPTSHPGNTHQTPCKSCTKQDMCMKPNVIPLTLQGHIVP